MHETIIASKVLEDLRKGVKGRKIKSARFEVGELAHITADELEETLKEMADFEFTVEEKKAKVKCRCGYIGVPEILDRDHDSIIFTCSKCGEIPEIVEGGDIKIVEVEVKE
ncbi:MAG TPA: hydrogenase/urease maturation nickel metallochaperone HypA [Candidatus Nanoarchaeia archaeon]|nr:hydrogenase/urease maturation nickel metallochaperone HypA [Candidatus Nanoarchaeia archaeon]